MRQYDSLPPFLWPSVLTVALLLALFAYVWPRRKVPGARVFALSFRILDPIPLAQQAAIEQMQSGMMVLDAGGVSSA